MNRRRAQRMYAAAFQHLTQTRPDMLDEARGVGPHTFKRLTAVAFLEQYCWVVYASGFRYAHVERLFPRIRAAFADFRLERLQRMRTIRPVLSAFNNPSKATSFLTGSKAIAAEGFNRFKKRLKAEGTNALESLPGVGPVTKHHLAKNIGLVDVAKPDIWLRRAASCCDCSVDELVQYLSASNGESHNVVDVAIWHYGATARLGPYRDMQAGAASSGNKR